MAILQKNIMNEMNFKEKIIIKIRKSLISDNVIKTIRVLYNCKDDDELLKACIESYAVSNLKDTVIIKQYKFNDKINELIDNYKADLKKNEQVYIIEIYKWQCIIAYNSIFTCDGKLGSIEEAVIEVVNKCSKKSTTVFGSQVGDINE